MAQNNPYADNPYLNNPNADNPYAAQPKPIIVKKADSIYTQRLKEHFSFFGIGSALYAVFYTFCLYKNASGITYPFFVAGTLCYFFFSMQKLGVPYKKDSIFYIISVVLLGISNCLTNSPQLLAMNKCGIFLLSFILMIHTIYMDKSWNFPKYLTALAQTIGIIFVCVFRPCSDMISYFDARKKNKDGKKSYFLPVLIGVVITIPVLLFMTLLLASADAVFADIFSRILDSINLETIFGTTFTAIIVFFFSYAVYAALSMKDVKEEVTDHRTLEPIIAIIVTVALSILYLMFSVIQILYLFIGNMQLPDGYTYSSYAREGFFQLLTVCILNLIIVLVCLYLFRENSVLKAILTIISGCTFIMILSSALRMLMYINRYNLTFLRIFVLWSLAVIFLLMAGVTVSIYMNKFPLFTYSMVIVTVFYIGLSFAHPDYWIAKYNLNPGHMEYLDDYDTLDSQKYLGKLSADAAPIVLSEKSNPYFTDFTDIIDQDGDVHEEFSWLSRYNNRMKELSKNMHIRNFNFSVHAAGRHAYWY
ncbi:MAG: DUF4173 domain-containing protein [Lachnospiraceae bacterium]|nr:DUF4173 domain-containing protein [Lachnospiraceae bacterium]